MLSGFLRNAVRISQESLSVLRKNAVRNGQESLSVLGKIMQFCGGMQNLLPYRSFNINDLIANMVGIILSIVIVVGWNFLRQKTSIFAKASVDRKGERQK